MTRLPADRPAGKSDRGNPDTSWRRVAAAGFGLIALTFGVVGGWAAVAKIDRAVAASGLVAIESNRKTVEHWEGGIIREILVKEGEAVGQGAILFRLENVQAKANYQLAQNQLYSLLAIEARLVAERDQKADNRVARRSSRRPLAMLSTSIPWTIRPPNSKSAGRPCRTRSTC